MRSRQPLFQLWPYYVLEGGPIFKRAALMRSLFRPLAPVLALSLAACAQMGPSLQTPTAPVDNAAPPPRIATANAVAAIDVSAFIASAAATQMSEKDKAEASSAQFYALQFGRPGAPRMWQGKGGVSGSITVGPYVRVNELDCRNFTHDVKTPKGDYPKSGLACRGTDGDWSVVDNTAQG